MMKSLRVLHTHLLLKEQKVERPPCWHAIGDFFMMERRRKALSTSNRFFSTVWRLTFVSRELDWRAATPVQRTLARKLAFASARSGIYTFAQFKRAEPGYLFLGIGRRLHHHKSGAGMFGPNPKVVRSDLNNSIA